jgi:hypothetical protein
MKIQKIKETFNDYKVELSWGQLNAIFRALEQDHADPLADELYAELGWYLENVPGPGEDEEEYKEAKDAEKQAIEGGDEAGMPGEEGRDPELLGQEIGAEEPEGAEGPVDTKAPMGRAGSEGEGGEEEFGGPAPAESPETKEADKFLERPPAD